MYVNDYELKFRMCTLITSALFGLNFDTGKHIVALADTESE